MNTIERGLAEVGYVRSPNNTLALPCVTPGESPIWYPNGPGIPCPPQGVEVQACHDRIRLFRRKFFGAAYTRRSHWDTVTVAVVEDAPDLIAWCVEHGRVSEGGAPAYSAGED